jgi:hypothetical protein
MILIAHVHSFRTLYRVAAFLVASATQARSMSPLPQLDKVDVLLSSLHLIAASLADLAEQEEAARPAPRVAS